MIMTEEDSLGLSANILSNNINEVKLLIQNLLRILIDIVHDDKSFTKATDEALHGVANLNEEHIIPFAWSLIQLLCLGTSTRPQAQPGSYSALISDPYRLCIGSPKLKIPVPQKQKQNWNDPNTDSGYRVMCTTTTESTIFAPNFALTKQPSSWGRAFPNTEDSGALKDPRIPRVAIDIVFPLGSASKEIIIKTRSTYGIKVNGVKLPAASFKSNFCLFGYLQTGDIIEVVNSE